MAPFGDSQVTTLAGRDTLLIPSTLLPLLAGIGGPRGHLSAVPISLTWDTKGEASLILEKRKEQVSRATADGPRSCDR